MFRRAGRRWIRAMGWILLFTFIVTLTMGIYIKWYEPERYVADYTFYALPPDVTEDVKAPVRMWMLIRDYDRLLDDDGFRQEIVADTISDGKTFVSARGKATDHVITIRAVGRDAMIAGGLANAVGERLVADSEKLFGVTTVHTISQARLQPQPTEKDDYLRLFKTMLVTFAVLSVLAILFGSRRENVSWMAPPAELQLTPLGQLADCRTDCEQCAKQLTKNAKKKKQAECRLLNRVDRLVREGVEEAALSIRAGAGRQSCSVAVTGVRAEDEAPVLAVLLAQTLAEDGYSVLMMEMDGDEPSLRRYLGVSGSVDTADCLRDDTLLPAAVLRTSIANLHMIDCCHNGDTMRQAAASPAFGTFVEDALEVYDYVILSAPPASFGGCAAAVGGAARQTVLAATDGRYTAKELNGVAEGLRQRGVRLSGVVFTGVQKRQLKDLYGGDGKAYQKGSAQA